MSNSTEPAAQTHQHQLPMHSSLCVLHTQMLVVKRANRIELRRDALIEQLERASDVAASLREERSTVARAILDAELKAVLDVISIITKNKSIKFDGRKIRERTVAETRQVHEGRIGKAAPRNCNKQ